MPRNCAKLQYCDVSRALFILAYLGTSYIGNLPTEEIPRNVIVSDFANVHLYDRETHGEPLCFKLEDIAHLIDSFLFMAGYKSTIAQKLEKIDRLAAEKMANPHDAMKAAEYGGKELEMYLVRLVFCLFAEDTSLFVQCG